MLDLHISVSEVPKPSFGCFFHAGAASQHLLTDPPFAVCKSLHGSTLI